MQATLLDRAGTFRIHIIEYGLKEGKDGKKSLQFTYKAQVLEQYDFTAKSWQTWGDYAPVELFGAVNLHKNDGTPMPSGVRQLVESVGWDCDLGSIAGQHLTPRDCQCSVKVNQWDGKTSYRGEWLNAWDNVPGGNLGNVDESRAVALANQYGSQYRAIAGSLAMNSAAPSGAPPAPPLPQHSPPPARVQDDSVPF